MVNHCAISMCKERYSTSSSVRFSGVMMHSIPKSAEASSKWLKVIKQFNPSFKPTAHTKVCSQHFKDSDYSLSVVSNRRVLKKEAIPNVFTNSPVSQNNMPIPSDIPDAIESTLDKEIAYDHTYSRRVPEIPDTEPRASTSSLYNPEAKIIPCVCTLPGVNNERKTAPPNESQFLTPHKPRKRKHYIGDFQFSDIEIPDCRLQFWHASQRSFQMQQKTIKGLRTKNQRLQQKIINLNQMIDRLKRENKVIMSVMPIECAQIHKYIPVRPSIN